MVDEEILELRRKLDESITNEKDYTYIIEENCCLAPVDQRHTGRSLR